MMRPFAWIGMALALLATVAGCSLPTPQSCRGSASPSFTGTLPRDMFPNRHRPLSAAAEDEAETAESHRPQAVAEAAFAQPAGDFAGVAFTGEAPKGEAPKGEAPKGEAPKGEAPAGEALTGEAPIAAVSAAEISTGEVAGQQAPDEHFLVDELPAPRPDRPEEPPELVPAPAPEAAEAAAAVSPLSLQAVLISLEQSYPLLRSLLLEYQLAEGKRLAAAGEFDLLLKTANEAAPAGFYQTYRNRVKLEQPTYQGGAVFGEYRIGRGFFEPWFGERQTNDGGEFKLGFEAALLKDRHIDRRRAAIFQADLDWQSVDPLVGTQLLVFARLASQAYWNWVAAAQAVDAQQQLLRLATQRTEQIEERVKSGDLEEIARIDNDRLIASREAKLIEAQRKLQAAAIKLSLYFRDEQGLPIVPDPSQAPDDFPAADRPPMDLDAIVAQAVAARPEVAQIDLQRQKVEVELAEAENKLLPKLDAFVAASQDVGQPTSPKRDKSPFKLEAGVFGEVPLQRREAQGKIHAAQGKLAQLNVKRQFAVDKITAEVQDAVSAMETAAERIERARTNVRLAERSLQLGREAFEAGDTDVIVLNIREEAVTDARLLLISAETDFFNALAAYRAALGLRPNHEMPDGAPRAVVEP